MHEGESLRGALRHGRWPARRYADELQIVAHPLPTVEFDAPVEQIRRLTSAGKEIPVLDDRPGMPGLQLSA